MSTSIAHRYVEPTSLKASHPVLGNAFKGNAGSAFDLLNKIAKDVNASNVTEKSENLDTQQFSPWVLTLRQRFERLIQAGEHSDAIKLLQDKLETPSELQREGVLNALDSALDRLYTRGHQVQTLAFEEHRKLAMDTPQNNLTLSAPSMLR